jgi:hypothetical protein
MGGVKEEIGDVFVGHEGEFLLNDGGEVEEHAELLLVFGGEDGEDGEVVMGWNWAVELHNDNR